MAKSKPNELRLVRVYDAPVKLVWEAFTNEKHQAKWWGPRGFTITTKSKDLRPGGQWIYTMHGPDGVDWPNIATYHEVEKYSRLVYDHGATETTPPLFRVTVTFEEFKGKTVMDMTMALENEKAAKEIGKFIKQASGNSTWDRLAEYLEEEQKQKEIFVINRTFEAPIATVFEMWSNPAHLSKWLPPTGLQMEILKGNIQEKGSLFYSMGNSSVTFYGRINYLNITPVTHLSYTQEFADKEGNLSRHPGAPTWPASMLTNVTFTEEDDGQTRVTVQWEPHGQVTSEELKAFIDEKPGMTAGWSGSFDKLDELLK